MDAILNTLTTIFNLATVLIGFGLIVFFHELGHFLAAKWAKVRVLAFALGFGSAIVSYRRGIGLRRGSSEREYFNLLHADPARAAALSPTEYRLNYLPLGGYVKMLGQEDLRPDKTSSAPDSYSMAHPFKRIVIISAGVIMNLLIAGLLFMAVFLIGLERQPPIIGAITPGGAAASAIAINADNLSPSESTLKPGDRVVSIDAHTPSTFDDLILAGAMGTPTTPVRIAVTREGIDQRLMFDILPKPGMFDGLLDLGIEPYRSNRVLDLSTDTQNAELQAALTRLGLPGITPGSSLISASDVPVTSAHDLDRIVRDSNGQPVPLVFEALDATRHTVRIQPVAQLQTDFISTGKDTVTPVEHLLGLSPVMTVEAVDETMRGYDEGLRTGDIFERIGSVEFPTLQQGMAEIKAHKGRDIQIVVRRGAPPAILPDENESPQQPETPTPSGSEGVSGAAIQRITINTSVTSAGTIGFVPGSLEDTDILLGLPPAQVTPARAGVAPIETAAARLNFRPGTRITHVGDTAVSNFTDLREALRAQTADAFAASQPHTVSLTTERLLAEGSTPAEQIDWSLTADEIAALHDLSWQPRFTLALFELDSFTLKAKGPIDALKTGLGETHRVMMSTYLTFVRLFQGTVRVEHLKGPVGITHMGTLIAERGPIWLLFFFALVSVNLAVINFLPLPIVDGGQFLLITYEWIRGRPAPIGFQNALTLAGLLLIGSIFIIVTFNDVSNLLGG